MRKQEYIHVHDLLLQIALHLNENNHLSLDELSDYQEIETKPSSVFERKENHHEAVITLSDEIVESVRVPEDSLTVH